MFDKLKEKLFLKHLKNAELDKDGVLRCRNGKELVAFLYVLDNKENIYVFNEYKIHRAKIEEIIANQRNNATHLHVADETDLGYNIGSSETNFCSVRETAGRLSEDGNGEHI